MTTASRAATNPTSTTSNPTQNERKRAADRSLSRARNASPAVATTGRTVGTVLRRLRGECGLGTRLLAKRAAVSRRAIQFLEDGSIRPRRCFLAALAYGLDPDDAERRKQIVAELVAAAGGEDALAPDGRWPHYRAKRFERGLLAGTVPWPAEIARLLALNQRADQLMGLAFELTDRPGALDDAVSMDRISALLDESRRLRDEAGGAVMVYIGGHRIAAGFGP